MKQRLVALVLCMSAMGAIATDRDPTVPPPEAGVTNAPPVDPGSASGLLQGSNVMVQNGQPYLVVGTRLYAVGQKVGAATLERITETEIWLREGGQLTKVQRFAGIQRTVARTAAACAAKPAASSARTKPRLAKTMRSESSQAETTAAPCEGAQP